MKSVEKTIGTENSIVMKIDGNKVDSVSFAQCVDHFLGLYITT